ncbi:unnamed protein product [Protopolystoma xenopodis]|uniref:Uncharacterized protein n=1 Tax=Protopolystoma xenopodis TaxID=117903 RepID=A0A3S5B7Z4_9PLAT|nr:unnamed protein product [Protopolystoma xenopodis]
MRSKHRIVGRPSRFGPMPNTRSSSRLAVSEDGDQVSPCWLHLPVRLSLEEATLLLAHGLVPGLDKAAPVERLSSLSRSPKTVEGTIPEVVGHPSKCVLLDYDMQLQKSRNEIVSLLTHWPC